MKVVVLPTVGTLAEQAPAFSTGPWQGVVVDVLRATSTIVAALEAGALAVEPRTTPHEVEAAARARAGDVPAPLRAGEREGVCIPGFDLGNSPLEFTRQAVAGRTVCFTTTNGTRALVEASVLGEVLCAAFLNRKAVVERLLRSGRDVVILCAGTEGCFSGDDVAVAGGVVEGLRRAGADVDADDLGLVAEQWFVSAGEHLAGLLARTRHGRHLLEIGFGADLEACGRLDVSPIVPVFRNGLIKPE